MSPAELQSARAALGWTVARLAEELGLTTRQVYRLLAGEQEPSGPTVRLLRHWLDSPECRPK